MRKGLVGCAALALVACGRIVYEPGRRRRRRYAARPGHLHARRTAGAARGALRRAGEPARQREGHRRLLGRLLSRRHRRQRGAAAARDHHAGAAGRVGDGDRAAVQDRDPAGSAQGSADAAHALGAQGARRVGEAGDVDGDAVEPDDVRQLQRAADHHRAGREPRRPVGRSAARLHAGRAAADRFLRRRAGVVRTRRP